MFGILLQSYGLTDISLVHAGGKGKHMEEPHRLPQHFGLENCSDLLDLAFPFCVRHRLEVVSPCRGLAFDSSVLFAVIFGNSESKYSKCFLRSPHLEVYR